MEYILGIDIGTTNTKAVAFSKEGKILVHASRSYMFSSPRPQYHELDPHTLYEAVTEVIAEALLAAQAHKLLAVSFSAAMHGLMAVNEQGEPLTALITWADLRSAEYADRLKNSPQGKGVYQRTGTPVHPMSPLCKLMWMKDHQPDLFAVTHRFISIKEYIFCRFFGQYLIDHSIASATGLFDIHLKQWDKEALQLAGISADRLSIPVPVTHSLRGVSRDLGIPDHVPFVIGGSDGCLAHIGSNALQHHDVSLTIGTSGAVRMMNTLPVQEDHCRIFNYLLTDDIYVSGGPVNNGGNVLQWFISSFLKMPINYDRFITEAMTIEPGCEGLVFLPYIYGERAPVWDAAATGIFFGIRASHRREHFMRAVLEGVCFGLWDIMRTLEQVSGGLNNIYASGGFIKSDPWVQLMADIAGRPLHITQAEDASAAGAVIIALKALGIINSFGEISDFFRVERTFVPDLAIHEICKRNYAVYSVLYNKLKDIKH